MKKQMVAVALMVCGCAVQAQVSGAEPLYKSRWQFVASVGVNLGGGSDEIVKGNYTDGSTFTIKAGNGNAFTAGLSYSLTDNFDVQVNIANEKTTTAATNGELGFYRLPVELLGFHNYGSN